MTDIELEQKLKEIVMIDSAFERLTALKKIKKDYHKSEFFKKNRIPFNKIAREMRIDYKFSFDYIGKQAQQAFNELDLSKISGILDEVTEIFTNENQEITENIELLKDLKSN